MKRALPVLLVVLMAASAHAEEQAPRIEHQAIEKATRGQPLMLKARITSATGRPLRDPVAMVRPAGTSAFARLPLGPVAGSPGQYAVDVPAALMTGDLDYYLEAFDTDGNGPGRSGTPLEPHHVYTVAADAPLALASTTVKLAPAPSRSHVPTVILFSTGSAALGLGIAATIGHLLIGSDAKRGFAGTDGGPTEREYLFGRGLGPVAAAGYVAGALLTAGGIAYLNWPDAPAAKEPR